MLPQAAVHEAEEQQGVRAGGAEPLACRLCGIHHNPTDTSLSWCFVTQDLVSWRAGGGPGAGCYVFEGRTGSIVKVLGRQVNLLSIEAAVQVRPCHILCDAVGFQCTEACCGRVPESACAAQASLLHLSRS